MELNFRCYMVKTLDYDEVVVNCIYYNDEDQPKVEPYVQEMFNNFKSIIKHKDKLNMTEIYYSMAELPSYDEKTESVYPTRTFRIIRHNIKKDEKVVKEKGTFFTVVKVTPPVESKTRTIESVIKEYYETFVISNENNSISFKKFKDGTPYNTEFISDLNSCFSNKERMEGGKQLSNDFDFDF